MTDRSPSSVLRSLVDRAVDADGTDEEGGAGGWSDDHAVVVTERGDDPGPVDALAAAVSGTEPGAGDREPTTRDRTSTTGDCDPTAGDRAGSIVGVVPRIEASTIRRLRDAVVESDPERTVRLVFTGPAAERLSGSSGAVLRAALERYGIEARVHAGDSSIAVLLVGECAVVGLFDDDGLAALLSTGAPDVRSWVAGVCRRYAAVADVSGSHGGPGRS